MSARSESTVAKAFGAKVTRLREKAGLSQEQLGYLGSLHRTQISLIERGMKMPRLDTVLKLAGALNVSPCELLSDMPKWTPPPPGPSSGGFDDGP